MAWTFSVLVVANVTATSPELLAALKSRAKRDRCRFTLLVPAPAAGAVGRQAARARLGEALELLRAEGLEAKGVAGDHDAIGAVSDIWDPTRFDEVVVSTLPTGVSKWLQVDLPRRIERTTDAQVNHVVAEPERAPPRAEPVHHVENYGMLAPLAALSGKRPERTSQNEQPGIVILLPVRRIGLLGGMSWESSAEYYRLINEEAVERLGGLHSADWVLRSVEFGQGRRA